MACINPYIDPENWPLLALISLSFPFLLAGVIFFTVFWLFIRRKWALISGIALIIGGGAITDFLAFKFFTPPFKADTPDQHIRVATWNVARFIEMVRNNNKGSQTRYKMLRQIKAVNADILCLQEFASSINPDWYNNIVAVSKGLDYPYYYFSHDVDGDRLFNGSVIFSKFPIADTGMVRYPRPTLPEALVFADIAIGNRSVRVYTTHLQSNQFRKEDISKIEELKGAKGNILGNARSIVSKLAVAIRHRSIQADMVQSVLGNSPYPVIFCGDLNDVPNSYTYKTIKGNMRDAFLQKGFGVGRTYSSLSPTLRIDYIFTGPDFSVGQFKRITSNLSDHYMIIADLRLN
ncbi:endonuclease/exonuclease/phosphatase family protein [Niabella terrae]